MRNSAGRPGSALCADVEHYDRTNADCVLAVRRYISNWTVTLHQAGYLAGVYVHPGLRVARPVRVVPVRVLDPPRPGLDGRWDGNRSLTGWPTAPNAQWAGRQRAKQYLGDHNETHGGVTINIDSDALNAPVATAALPYRVTSSVPLSPSNTTYSSPLPKCTYPGPVTSSTPLNARTGPSRQRRRCVSGYDVGNRSAATWSAPIPPLPVISTSATPRGRTRARPGRAASTPRRR